ncbi:MAG: polysaccharide deacetylase family protein [Bacteroidota bacterium]
MIAVHYERGECPERIGYVLDFLVQHPLAPPGMHWQWVEDPTAGSSRSLYYGKQPPVGLRGHVIPAQRLLFREQLPDCSTLRAGRYRWRQQVLYSVEKNPAAEAPFFTAGRFGFDLFETIFFHLSRLEEYQCTPEQHDQWDLLRAEFHFLVREGLERLPVVDQLVRAFYEALGYALSPRPTTYELSHDIDIIQKFRSPGKVLRSMGSAVYRGWGLGAVGRIARRYWGCWRRGDRDPFDTFDWLLSGAPVRKRLYLMTGGITPYDRHYDVEEDLMRRGMSLALERGYELGLHPSYAAYRRLDLLRAEKERLERVGGQPVGWSRQHFLHFAFPETADLLEGVGVTHDSTWGYQDRIGFRCGTGFAYRPYHFLEKRAYRFWEVPMIVMDSALLKATDYQPDRFHEQFWELIQSLPHDTHLTFNFHNSTFDDTWWPDQWLRKIYLDIPTYFQKEIRPDIIK